MSNGHFQKSGWRGQEGGAGKGPGRRVQVPRSCWQELGPWFWTAFPLTEFRLTLLPTATRWLLPGEVNEAILGFEEVPSGL